MMVLVLLFAVIAAGSAFPQIGLGSPSESVLVPVRSYHSTGTTNQFHQEDSGAVRFGFAHAGQVKSEFKDPTGNVYGYYSYTIPSQKPTIVLYKAGPNGFEVSSNKLPEKVQDTPAVVAARENFLRIYERVAKRKRDQERAKLEAQMAEQSAPTGPADSLL